MNVDIRELKLLRSTSNDAILSRDLAGVCSSYVDDVIVISAEGGALIGLDSVRGAWGRIFKDLSGPLFVRKAADMTVSKNGKLAWESGQWEYSDGRPGGNYSAMWVRTSAGWKIRSELFVGLG